VFLALSRRRLLNEAKATNDENCARERERERERETSSALNVMIGEGLFAAEAADTSDAITREGERKRVELTQ
jgi:hypothetical protein